MIERLKPRLMGIKAIFCPMRQRFVAALALSLMLLTSSGCASLVRPNFETEVQNLRPGNYVLDPNHTFVLFRVDHLGLSQVIGRFNDVEASLNFDPANIEALELEGRLSAASIDLGNPEFESQLRGGSWLDVDNFPSATFETESVVAGADGALTIDGLFTLHGVTEPLQLQARFNGGADNILTGKYTLGFTANGTLSRSAHGIKGFAALVGDTISVEIQAEFQKQ